MYHFKRIQKGRGLGGFFAIFLKIFRKATPILKKVVQSPTTKKIARKAAETLINQITKEKNTPQDDFNFVKTGTQNALNQLSSKSNIKKRKIKNTPSFSKQHKKKKIQNNLFD